MGRRNVLVVSILVGVVGGAGCTVTDDNGLVVGIDDELLGVDNDDAEAEAEATGSGDRRLQAASGDVAKEDVTFVLETDHDVDTVYARIRRVFDFQTLDERESSDELRRELIKMDVGHHHRKTPGVQYSLREMQEIHGHRAVMQIDIDREGDGSRVHVGYYTGNDAFPEGEAFQERVKDKLRRALE
ncbi:hypothetical protein SAMN04488052_11453 [Aquisalimonas asiatica]|uniref:Uncharacterized protein n=2 Tax=Aquisalimonas asiatica TaxID=406100 RepID=A0A1H8VQG0_9GAMM|nr:hypothetical protein SAMN04488052_11453 [Aquisalimonas asiatica]